MADIYDFSEVLNDFGSMLPSDFIRKYDNDLYHAIYKAKKGRLVIRIIEGGNEYMKVGQSKSGSTRAFTEGLPLVIEFPNGYYQSTVIELIDWEAGTFRTKCSTYHFHFLDE